MKSLCNWLILSCCILLSYLIMGCTQPIATSGTLLTSGSSTSTGTPVTDTPEDTGELDIKSDTSEITMNVDDNDRVEISGNCSDLNRKKNRILVEVFSSENENDIPYISNAISDRCQVTAGGNTGNGLPVGDTCFWVTKGVGLIEDIGLPSQKSFPQCHNGRFGFSVRLGAVMVNPAPSGSRYTVRFKIRTVEGSISESPWSKVYVSRKLAVPSIDKITSDQAGYRCTLEMSPARFNENIKYTLSRVAVGAVTTPPYQIFPVPLDGQTVTSGTSLYNFVSDNTTPLHRVIAGVTYTYTLVSQDQTDYFNPPLGGGFTYAAPLIQTSTPASCTINRPRLNPTVPTTNTPVTASGTGATCYASLAPGSLPNPALGSGFVEYEWAFSTVANWTGANKDAPRPNVVPLPCNTSTTCNISSLNAGIVASTPYYISVRERDTDSHGGLGMIGKWGDEVTCVVNP